MNKNTFAPTPPMGWNSYDYYDTTVNETQIRANAEYMAKYLKPYGWEYIIVDIQWYAHNAGSKRTEYQYIPFSSLEMDAYSRLLPDPKRFPSSAKGAGFAPLANYIHQLGLKFGIHIMRGIPRIAAHQHTPILGCNTTADQIADPSSICGWNPDMYGVRNIPEGQAYYDSLLKLYASWGVDYIKCDDICNTNLYPQNPYSARHEIEMLSLAIERCNRPIVLSLSPGPALIEQAWHYEKYANMWRITDDFWDNWASLKDMFYRCELWQNHVSPGCYPDCDMLPLGYLGKGFGQERTTNFTLEEQRTMLTLWCLFGSPLMLGAEMTKLDEQTLSLLTNQNILAMHSPACRPKQLSLDNNHAVWTAQDFEKQTYYIALFNLSEKTSLISIGTQEVLDTFSKDFSPYAKLKELWTNEILSLSPDFIKTNLTPHACSVYSLEI